MSQHSAKIAQHSFQEDPQHSKKPSKVLYCRRFFAFRIFLQDRAQDPKNVPNMLPKVRQVGHLGLQVGHLGHILAPSWPTWRHLGPSWRQDAPQREPQMRSESHLGQSWRQEVTEDLNSAPGASIFNDFSSNSGPNSIDFSSSFL